VQEKAVKMVVVGQKSKGYKERCQELGLGDFRTEKEETE
jgi:hypothetical protein